MSAVRYPMYGFDAKWVWPQVDELVCPARITGDLRRGIEATATATCDALRVRDWARIDIRLDGNGRPNVLEVNSLPGILPAFGQSGFTLAAFTAGFDYSGMIRELVHIALERYGSR